MSDTELSDIDGIGPARAETMAEDLGIDSVEQLAMTNPSDLTGLSAVNEETATEMVTQAADALEADEDDLDVDAELEELDDLEAEIEADDEGPNVFPIELEIQGHIFPFAIRAISSHYAVAMGRNNIDGMDRVGEMLEAFTRAYDASQTSHEDTVTVGLEATMNDLNTLDNAFSEEVRRCRSSAGTNSIHGDVKLVLKQIGELRDEHWGN